jgi:cation transport regulator ChaB
VRCYDPIDVVRQVAPLSRRVGVRFTNLRRQRDADEGTMPYRSNDDLPAAVQQLTAAQQSQWRAVFNRVHASDGEAAARKAAWAAVKEQDADERVEPGKG